MCYRSTLKFFWQHIKPYKWWYALMLSAPVVTSFYPFAYNYAIKLFLDTMVQPQTLSYQAVLLPVVLFIVTQFLLDVFWRISNFAEWRSEPYVRRSILLRSYQYVQHHSYQFFQDNFSGAISSKLKGLLDGYDKFWAEMHHGLLVKILKTVVNLTALLFINIKLGLFIMLWASVYVPIMYTFSIKLNKLSYIETESRHALIGSIADKIMNMFAIFSFSARKRELDNLDHAISEDFIPKQVKVYKFDFIGQLIGGLLYQVMFIFILFYMIHLKINGLVTIGDFAFVFGLTLVVAEDIWHATVSLQEFARAMGDLKSSLSIIDAPQESRDRPNAQTLNVIDSSIEFTNVCFTYSDNKSIFNNLNLVIKPGEKIGLVGHSGAGKSSLINLLLRYFEPSSGQIRINGTNIAEVTQDSLRDHIAVIPQDSSLFHRSILDNIRFGKPQASIDEIIEASKKAHIHDFIMSLPNQYETFVGERGVKLSGGQRQRVSIARAILKDAPILILDEATSSLDSHTEQLIQDSLNFYMEDQEKTVIAIAHRLSTLKHMNRIIVLDKGKIIEEGTHDELISSKGNVYKKLWELQEL